MSCDLTLALRNPRAVGRSQTDTTEEDMGEEEAQANRVPLGDGVLRLATVDFEQARNLIGSAGYGVAADLGRNEVGRATLHPEKANCVTSLARTAEPPDSDLFDFPGTGPDDDALHHVAVDVDCPVEVYPSSKEGHFHLYIKLPKPVPTEDYMELLRAMSKVGILEPGYVLASMVRGHSTLRLPWVKKERADFEWEAGRSGGDTAEINHVLAKWLDPA